MLATLLLVSNICNCIVPWAYYRISECVAEINCDEDQFWQIICACLAPLSVGCFSVAHWLFASQYYKIAQVMPYALEELLVPKGMEKKQKWVSGVMVFMNIIFSLILGPTIYFRNEAAVHNDGRTPEIDKYFILSSGLIAIMNVVSCIFFFVAVYRITKYMNKQETELDKVDRTS